MLSSSELREEHTANLSKILRALWRMVTTLNGVVYPLIDLTVISMVGFNM